MDKGLCDANDAPEQLDWSRGWRDRIWIGAGWAIVALAVAGISHPLLTYPV
jgi:hypothetical protein